MEQTPEENENSNAVYDAARDEKVTELGILQQSLDEKKKLAEDYYDQILRMRAEFENYRRRAEKDKQNHLIWGKEEILTKQICLLDVLEQATQSARTSNNIESILKGLEIITMEFQRMLQSEGIEVIPAEGGTFDPSLHEALERRPGDQPEGTIVAILQKGYRMNGRVIRPSRVAVAVKKEESTEVVQEVK